MARIALRAYNRDIEAMIDKGHYEEAIAHCRHILEQHPKYIDIYRLLGKALLEDQRLSDASDVFQRVLSSIPDDFISHLGMSIIREDEGDLEAAIWHMERAFEVQPSNAAIQAELRRLYGRRDGLSPAKIQLTRGALARMSAKSNLNSQAISELRAVLADDPGRADLLVVLVQLYARTGQNMAAIENCNTLLNKLPYCLEANRIMAELLPGTERAKEAQVYRERYEELDPYAAQITPSSLAADQIPDGAVTLELLEFKSLEPSEGTRGVTYDTEGIEDIPEWLKESSHGMDTDLHDEVTGASRKDWLDEPTIPEADRPTKQLGEVPSSTPDEQEMEEGETMIPDEELEEEIPDESGQDEQSPAFPESQKSPEEIESDEAVSDSTIPVESSESIDQGEEVPDWLQELGVGLSQEQKPVDLGEQEFESPSATQEPTSEDEPAEFGETLMQPDEAPGSLPEWLAEASTETESDLADQLSEGEQEAEIPEPEELARAEVPDWLRQMEEEYLEGMDESLHEPSSAEAIELSQEEKETSSGDIPSWLIAAMESEESPLPDEPEGEQLIEGDTQPIRVRYPKTEPSSAEEFPSFKTSTFETEVAESVPSETKEGEEEDHEPQPADLPAMSDEDKPSALAWLESLDTQQDTSEEDLLKGPADMETKMPEWVHKDMGEESHPGPAEAAESIEREIADEFAGYEPEEELAEEPPPMPPEETGASEWVHEIEESETGAKFPEAVPEIEEEIPTWLRAISQEADEEETAETWVTPESEVQPGVSEAIPAKLDINSASLIQLERIPGIGFILAQNIVDYRETKGTFNNLAELEDVPGFTAGANQDLDRYLTVEVVTGAPPPPSTLPELQDAWDKVSSGEIANAIDAYQVLIHKEEHLDDVIRDLQEAISLHSAEPALYQTLGDAYVRANRLQEALDSYNHAEDLL